jgi:hypothetical protein
MNDIRNLTRRQSKVPLATFIARHGVRLISIMKNYSIILISSLLLVATSLSAAELPKGIPDPIDSNFLFATIAESRELKHDYPELNIKNLEEINGYYVIGKKQISSSARAIDMIRELQKTASEDGPLAMCFEPRHYITYKSIHGDVSLAICFKCTRVSVSLDGWHKTLSLNEVSAKELNEYYKSIDLVVPKMYREKPNNKIKNHGSLHSSDAFTRPLGWALKPQ